MKKIKVGICQFEPTLGEKGKNLETINKLLTDIDADIIVLPELATTGYNFSTKASLLPLAEDKDGETAALLKRLSKENECSYVVGFAELAGGDIFNSSMLVNPDGTLFIYRKIHLFGQEKSLFCSGDKSFFVARAKGGIRVGMMICFDWFFPESARSLALLGADVICHSANLVLPWCQNSMPTRALENRITIATANRIGSEGELYFTGKSQIISHNAEKLLSFDATEVGTKWCEIVFNQSKKLDGGNDPLTERKKHLYCL